MMERENSPNSSFLGRIHLFHFLFSFHGLISSLSLSFKSCSFSSEVDLSAPIQDE